MSIMVTKAMVRKIQAVSEAGEREIGIVSSDEATSRIESSYF